MVFKNSPLKMTLQFFTLCLLYCFQSPVSNAIPFIYFRSELSCKINEEWVNCTESELCENNYEYEFINKNGVESLSMEYGLICNKRLVEATIISLGFLGEVSAYFIAIVTEIPKQKKNTVIGSMMLFEGLLMFSLAFIKGSIIYATIVIFIWNFVFSYLYSQMFAFCYDMYTPEIADSAVNYTNIAWTGGAVLFAIFSQFTGNWIHHCAYFGGLVVLVLAVLFILFSSPPYQDPSQQTQPLTQAQLEQSKRDDTLQTEEKQKNFIGGLLVKFKEIQRDDAIFLNAILYSLLWSTAQSSFYILFIAFNALGGNIQIPVFISIIVDFISSFVAKSLLSKHNTLRLVLNNLLIIGVIQLGMVFVSNEDYYLQFFCIIASKISTRIMFPTAITLLQSIVPFKYNQLVFNIGNVIAIGIATLLPYYRYYMDNIGVHIFSGMGLCTLIYYFFAKKFKIIVDKHLTEGLVGRKSQHSRRKSEKILDDILRRSSMMTSKVQMMLLDKDSLDSEEEEQDQIVGQELLEVKQVKQV